MKTKMMADFQICISVSLKLQTENALGNYFSVTTRKIPKAGRKAAP